MPIDRGAVGSQVRGTLRDGFKWVERVRSVSCDRHDRQKILVEDGIGSERAVRLYLPSESVEILEDGQGGSA